MQTEMGIRRERGDPEGNKRGLDKQEKEMDRGRNANTKAEAGTGARESPRAWVLGCPTWAVCTPAPAVSPI